jgi:hypothetical protein
VVAPVPLDDHGIHASGNLYRLTMDYGAGMASTGFAGGNLVDLANFTLAILPEPTGFVLMCVAGLKLIQRPGRNSRRIVQPL